MPVSKSRIPKLCRHRSSNRAFVRLPEGGSKRTVYLGRWGSAAARETFDKVIQEWLNNDRQLPAGTAAEPEAVTSAYSIAELCADFIEHAQTYYAKNGEITDEFHCLQSALRPLRLLYAEMPAYLSGPKALMNVREAMVGKGWTRAYANNSVRRIRRAFAWAVSQEKVKGEVWYRLSAVKALSKGRTAARDNPPVTPTPQSTIDLILPLVSRQVKALMSPMNS